MKHKFLFTLSSIFLSFASGAYGNFDMTRTIGLYCPNASGGGATYIKFDISASKKTIIFSPEDGVFDFGEKRSTDQEGARILENYIKSNGDLRLLSQQVINTSIETNGRGEITAPLQFSRFSNFSGNESIDIRTMFSQDGDYSNARPVTLRSCKVLHPYKRR